MAELITVGAYTIGLDLSAKGIAAGAAAAGAGMGAAGLVGQAQAQRRAAQYNARIAAMEAESIREAAKYEEREARKEGKKLKARQLVQVAKGGTVPGVGTPLLLQTETAAEIEKDIRLMRYGYGLKRSQALSRGRYGKMMGRAKSRASVWGAGKTLATGTYRTASLLG